MGGGVLDEGAHNGHAQGWMVVGFFAGGLIVTHLVLPFLLG